MITTMLICLKFAAATSPEGIHLASMCTDSEAPGSTHFSTYGATEERPFNGAVVRNLSAADQAKVKRQGQHLVPMPRHGVSIVLPPDMPEPILADFVTWAALIDRL